MWKNRLNYALIMLVLLILLVLFSKPFLLAILLLLSAVALLLALFTWHDAESIRTSVSIQSGGREGSETPMTFCFASKKRLLAARSILVEMEAYNEMFCETAQKRMLFALSDTENEYTVSVPLVWCGKVTFRCTAIHIQDIFGLFRMQVAPFQEVCTVIYPHLLQLSTEISDTTIGTTRNDGLMQNRKGSDPSEMFDIREYIPGDDVRTIHWKLSGKTDQLIVRQPSDPSHYNIALLPDFGRIHQGKTASQAELNAAVALSAAIAEQLVLRGVPFCTVLPEKDGVRLYEIRNAYEFHTLLPQWLSFPIQENAGSGLQYFMMEHLDQRFTRLLLFCAGKYEQDLYELDQRIGVLVLHTSEAVTDVRIERNGSCEMMEFPTEQAANEVYRVVC